MNEVVVLTQSQYLASRGRNFSSARELAEFTGGLLLTQEQYDRIRAARAQGIKLNTHAEIQAFLGMRPTAPPNVQRVTKAAQAETPLKAQGASVAVGGDTMACWSCGTTVKKDVRCAQCGALIAG